MDDVRDRQYTVIETIKKDLSMVLCGKELTEEKIGKQANFIRDVNMCILAIEAAECKVPDRDRISAINKLQHYVERQRMMTQGADTNPLDVMVDAWKRAQAVAEAARAPAA